LCFFVTLFNKRKLIASAATIESYKSIIDHASTLDIKLSSYYDAVLPFESLYSQYRADVWWYDIYLIVTGLLLTSVTGALISDERAVMMVSIVVLLLSYVMQGYLKPYKYTLEDTFSYFSTFYLIVIFICTYVQATSGLGDKVLEKAKYDSLDLFLVASNFMYVTMAVCFVYSHLKGKSKHNTKDKRVGENNTDITEEDDEVLIDDDDITKYLKNNFENSNQIGLELDIPEHVSVKDLLTLMGALFFLMAPYSVYNNMKRRSSDLNDLMYSYHISDIAPTIAGGHGAGQEGYLAVFPLPHQDTHDSLWSTILRRDYIKKVRKVLDFTQLFHLNSKKRNRTHILHKHYLENNRYARKLMNQLDFPVAETELLGNMSSVGFIDYCETFILKVNDDSIFKIESDNEDNDDKLLAAIDTNGNEKNGNEISDSDDDDSSNNSSNVSDLDNFAVNKNDIDCNDVNFNPDLSSNSDA
jgi:hypothetical protein